MNKVISRLLIFFVGIPIIIGIVCLKFYNHLVLHATVCVVSVIAANELYNIFAAKTKLHPKWLVLCRTCFIPFIASLTCVLPAFGIELPVGQEIITYALIISFMAVLAYEVITARTFEESNLRLASSAFIILYAGYLLTFISRMTTFTRIVSDTEHATVTESVSVQFISVFLLMVFICDSLAWFFGMLFGKNNRGYVKASPNKSIVGFVAGFFGSVLAGLAGYFIWPEIFYGSVAKIIVTGVIVALFAIIGDLIESIFKRSSEFKDSGHIIPGRGGILDSIDSILMSAPVYFVLVCIFYGPLF